MPIIAASRKRRVQFITEDWTGTGLPTGWSFNGTGTCNPDFSGGSPQGGHCLRVLSNTAWPNGGARFPLNRKLTTYGIYAQVLFENPGNRNVLVTLADACYWGFYPTQQWNGVNNSGFAAWTWYHIWVDGTPSGQSLYRSTTSTKPSSPTFTRSAINLSLVAISSPDTSNQMLVDKLRVANYHYGSNPS